MKTEKIIIIFSIILFFTLPVYARLIFVPSQIDSLTVASDIVVAAHLKNVIETNERAILSEGMKGIGIEAVFDVITVFKGDASKKEIIVHYYKNAENPRIQINGPYLIYLSMEMFKVKNKETGEVENKVNEFLLFLKKMDDGRYMPSSGYYDSGFSVRRIEY